MMLLAHHELLVAAKLRVALPWMQQLQQQQ
jgi:hypothetical protein